MMVVCLKSLSVFLSFTPGFSPVINGGENHRNRFQRFLRFVGSANAW